MSYPYRDYQHRQPSPNGSFTSTLHTYVNHPPSSSSHSRSRSRSASHMQREHDQHHGDRPKSKAIARTGAIFAIVSLVAGALTFYSYRKQRRRTREDAVYSSSGRSTTDPRHRRDRGGGTRRKAYEHGFEDDRRRNGRDPGGRGRDRRQWAPTNNAGVRVWEAAPSEPDTARGRVDAPPPPYEPSPRYNERVHGPRVIEVG